jgi:hypothetical protein
MSTGSVQTVPRKRRGTELLLLLAALVVGVGAYVAAEVGYNGKIPDNVGTVAGGFAALAHMSQSDFLPPTPTRCCCRWW